MRRLFAIAMLLLSSGIALGIGLSAAVTMAAPPPIGQEQATRIETDQKTGAVKIIVNGKEVARFNARGLQVKDSIEYGGTITDSGSSDAEYAKRISRAEPKP